MGIRRKGANKNKGLMRYRPIRKAKIYIRKKHRKGVHRFSEKVQHFSDKYTFFLKLPKPIRTFFANRPRTSAIMMAWAPILPALVTGPLAYIIGSAELRRREKVKAEELKGKKNSEAVEKIVSAKHEAYTGSFIPMFVMNYIPSAIVWNTVGPILAVKALSYFTASADPSAIQQPEFNSTHKVVENLGTWDGEMQTLRSKLEQERGISIEFDKAAQRHVVKLKAIASTVQVLDHRAF